MQNGRAAGFMLIEVLVALLMLALGTLSAAALQLVALRSRQQADLLSHAVQLASGMADKMRANVLQMQQDDRDNPYLNVHYDAASDAAPATPSTLCLAASPCDSAQLAAADIFELEQQLKAALPAARLLICRDGQPWDSAAKRLTWRCSGVDTEPIVIKLGWQNKSVAALDAHAAPRVAMPLAGQ